MTPIIKIKAPPRTVIKGKMDARFPAGVSAFSPILLTKAGGNYAFSFDTNAAIQTLSLTFQPKIDFPNNADVFLNGVGEFVTPAGAGDMSASVYDPNGVAADAFDQDNMVDGTTNKNYTATEKTKLSGIASGAEVNVNADWNSGSGDAQILNKPTLGTAAATDATAYATAAQGGKADSAVQTLVEGTNITIDATDPQNPIINASGGSGSVANPTATIGLTAINGSASSAVRSDGAPALSQAIVPTWTALHTFDAGIVATDPVVSGTFIGSAGSALFAVNQVGDATSATVPEIGAQFHILSSAGIANAGSAYKIAMTASAVGDENSANVYGGNIIAQGHAGSGGYLVTVLEGDINNVGADATDLGADTAAYGFVAVASGTAKSTAAYWATGVDPAQWTYGFASQATSGNGVGVVDFYGNSKATYFAYDDGDHSGGIKLAGTYSSAPAIEIPTGSTVGFSSGGGMTATSTYVQFVDPSGNNDVSFGGTGDPTNYFSNTAHQFYNRASSVHYATIDANGIKSDTYLGSAAPTTKTGTSSTLTSTDVSVIYNASGTHTTTLPSASSLPGRWLYVKSIAAQAVNSASSNIVPIGSATAGTALLASGAGKWASLQSNGTSWVVMAAN